MDTRLLRKLKEEAENMIVVKMMLSGVYIIFQNNYYHFNKLRPAFEFKHKLIKQIIQSEVSKRRMKQKYKSVWNKWIIENLSI